MSKNITKWIADNAVTYAKIQNVSDTNQILGRKTAGAGVVEELAKADVLTMINVEDGADVTDAANVQTAGALILAGIAGGQTANGGTASGDDLTLSSTANATKGSILLGSLSAYDEVNERFGIGQTIPTSRVHVKGAGATSATFALKVEDSANANLFSIRDDGTAAVKTLYTNEEYSNGNSGVSITLDPANGSNQSITMTANCTFTLTAPTNSRVGKVTLRVIQGGVGSFVITWPASTQSPSGTAPLLSTAVAAEDYIVLYHNGTDWMAVLSATDVKDIV